jgi:hypothetical protein
MCCDETYALQDWSLTYLAFVVLDLDRASTDILLADTMLPGPYLDMWSAVFGR